MTLDDISNQLYNLANSGDPEFAQAATYVAQVAQAVQSGQMSTAEMAEILRDVQRQLSIIDDMSRLAFKETLNSCITGLITLAGLPI